VKRYDTKVEEATTPSLEALKAYSQGILTRRTKGDFDSQAFFRRAIELDPNFALAHARLGTVLSNLGQRDDALKAATRAYELRDKVSERERLYIEARYFTTVKTDLTKAIDLHRLIVATYPDDFGAYSNLGSLLRSRGMLEEAIPHLEQAVRLAPEQPLAYVNLGYAHLDAGRFEDARKAFESTIRLQESGTARSGLFIIGVLTGDQALSTAQVEAVRGRREELDMLGSRMQAAAYRGRATEASLLADELFGRLQALKRHTQAGEGLLGMGIGHAMVGRQDLARKELARVRANGMLRDGTSDELVALGTMLGDTALVQATLDQAIAHMRTIALPEEGDKGERGMKALAALAAGRNQEAYDLATSVGDDVRDKETMFVACLAASRLQRWDDAARILAKLASFKTRLGLSPLPATVHIMLGRAHAAAGRPAEAKKAYEEAFRIWKDADPDLPILVAAKKEHASLGV
jgi:tetratricopeptide (TPR) repeat protein